MPKKLTEVLKKEILEAFKLGKSLSILAKEYGYTPTTITRTVKSFLTDDEFTKLKGNRLKGSAILKKQDTKEKHFNIGDSQPLGSAEITSQEKIDSEVVSLAENS